MTFRGNLITCERFSRLFNLAIPWEKNPANCKKPNVLRFVNGIETSHRSNPSGDACGETKSNELRLDERSIHDPCFERSPS